MIQEKGAGQDGRIRRLLQRYRIFRDLAIVTAIAGILAGVLLDDKLWLPGMDEPLGGIAIVFVGVGLAVLFFAIAFAGWMRAGDLYYEEILIPMLKSTFPGSIYLKDAGEVKGQEGRIRELLAEFDSEGLFEEEKARRQGLLEVSQFGCSDDYALLVLPGRRIESFSYRGGSAAAEVGGAAFLGTLVCCHLTDSRQSFQPFSGDDRSNEALKAYRKRQGKFSVRVKRDALYILFSDQYKFFREPGILYRGSYMKYAKDSVRALVEAVQTIENLFSTG